MEGRITEDSGRKAWGGDGDRVYLFGDRAFFLEDGVIGAYSARNGIPLTKDESIFNACRV